MLPRSLSGGQGSCGPFLKCAKLDSAAHLIFFIIPIERRERAVLSGLGGPDSIGYLAVLFIFTTPT
jgi:hypothetical protein